MINKKNTIKDALAYPLMHRKKAKKKSTLAVSIAAILMCSSVGLAQAAAIPGTLQAEDYDAGGEGIAYHDTTPENYGGQYRQDGVDIEFSSSGGFNVGWVNDGEWLNYSISVAEAGTYSLDALVASQDSGGDFYFEINGATQVQSSSFTFGGTGGWHNWIKTNNAEVELNAGEHTLRLVVNRGGFNIDSISINNNTDLIRGSYIGSPVSIPGILQAEDYDIGGAEVAYHDKSQGNAFGHYRNDNVDIEAGLTGQHIGWVEPGEWIEYTIDVTESGDYDFSALIASNEGGGGLHFEVDGQVSSTTNFSGTGGWQNWVNSAKSTLPVSAGQHILRVVIDSGVFNIDSLKISPSGNDTITQGPYLDTPAVVPGTIQAENYDLGGSGIAYHDLSDGNAFGEYRTDSVDIEAGSAGNQHIGWVEQGEWLEYTIEVAESGNYDFSALIASNDAGGSLHLEVDGQVSPPTDFSATGGWQNWVNTQTSTHSLSAGQHVLRLVIDSGAFNIDSFAFSLNVPPVDTDGDGVSDELDAFPMNSAEWLDSDMDGTGDNEDAFPNDASETLDSDLDGVGDNTDIFPVDASETIDSDADGTGDNADLDDDNDGHNDDDDLYPLDPTRWQDDSSTGLTLVWSDEFDNINFNNWSHDVGGQGWGNSELQYYTDGNNVSTTFDAQANSNVLVMEARKENPNNYQCWYGTCEYTSSKLVSADKQVFMHGRIEGRMKVPQTQGIWAAFWMLGTNLNDVGWPRSGEIDIMEHVGQEPTINHGALHGLGYSGSTPIFGTNDLGESIDENFHVFAVEWDENGIAWYVDDVEFYSVTREEVEVHGNWAFDHEFYVILNVAVGGTWPGSPDGGSYPQQMLVDYVRVYQDSGSNQGSDVDGDGYTDDIDAFPTDPTEWLDSDGDTMGDNEDALPFNASETIDTDLDGIGNNADTDDDNDGCLDSVDLSPLDPNTCDEPVYDSVVPIFTEGVGLTNGFTWQFWSWDVVNHSVTNPDGTAYTVGGPARLNMAGGSSIPFEKADRTDTDIDATGAQSFSLTYSSDKPFEVLLLWGVTPEGWASAGYPYWSAVSYLEGGFLQVLVPASAETTEFTIDFADIDNPVNKYFVEEEGMPAAVVDTSKMQMLLFKSPDELVNVTINNVQFGEGTAVIPVDTDGDGYIDSEDAFPENELEWLDTDKDGTGDNSDLDIDGDGVSNVNDAYPLDATRWEIVLGTDDSDGDGVINDEDAFPNDVSEWLDTDGDGMGDNSDLFPTDGTETTDTDGDGTGDNTDACPLDSDPACVAIVEPDFRCEKLDDDCLAIFDRDAGLLNGFTWRFWTWNDTHNVTDPDGSVYVEGPARFNMAPGTSIPFEQDDVTKSEIDASASDAFRLTYSSEEPFEVLILWGGPVAGWTEPGYPYWTESTYMDGGFLLVQVPASSEMTEFAMDFADMPTPVSDYFVNQLGMAEAITDLTKVQMLLLKNSGKEELVSVVITDMAFGESGPEPIDTDGDGVFDAKDAFPLDSTEWIDTDGDLIGNNADNNDDNDSCIDGDDAYPLDASRCEAQNPTDFISYPGYTGVYPGFTLMIDDRFNALDTAIWETGDGGFNENDCRFQPEGVQFNNGSMELVITEQAVDASNSVSNGNQMVAAKNYTCGELRTKETYLYGRLEARVRTPNPEVASGYISSLFTYLNDPSDGFRWREIDVEMEGARPTKFQRNLIYGEGTWIWNDTRAWGAYEEVIEIGNTSDWRVYAIEWTETEILWYVDGVLESTLTANEVSQFNATIPELASKIMMNFWIPNDQIQNAFGGNKAKNVYPMVAEYDWFRYYTWNQQ